MHKLTTSDLTTAWPASVSVPIPGEEHKAGGGIGTAETIEGADANGGVTYTALSLGVRVRHLGGTSQTLAIGVAGSDITVQLGTDGAAAVTSTANDVHALWYATAAAFALADEVPTGTGAGLAAVSPGGGGWVELADGGDGSILTPLLALQQRTDILAERAGAWGPPVSVVCEDNKAITIALALAVGGILRTTGTSYTPTVGTISVDTWYYLYAKVTAGAIAFEHGTTAPDAYQQHKSGDTTRRFVCAFRTYTDAFNGNADNVGIHPFRRGPDGRTHYLFPVLVGSAKADTAYADQSAAVAVPPHGRLATIMAVLSNGSGAQNRVEARAKGIAEGGVGLNQPVLYTSGTLGAGRAEVGLTSGQVFEYKIGSASTSTVDLYVVDWS